MATNTAWAHWSAWRSMTRLGREMGHAGLLVSHYIYDRAVFKPVFRHHRQMHEARAAHERQISDEGTAHLLWLLSWEIGVPCTAHGAQNALKWGLAEWIQEKATLRRCFIACESVRNSFGQIMRVAPSWLARNVRFEDTASCYEEFWQVMGLKQKVVEVLVALELRLHDNCIYVAKRWEDVQDFPQMLFAAVCPSGRGKNSPTPVGLRWGPCAILVWRVAHAVLCTWFRRHYSNQPRARII